MCYLKSLKKNIAARSIVIARRSHRTDIWTDFTQDDLCFIGSYNHIPRELFSWVRRENQKRNFVYYQILHRSRIIFDIRCRCSLTLTSTCTWNSADINFRWIQLNAAVESEWSRQRIVESDGQKCVVWGQVEQVLTSIVQGNFARPQMNIDLISEFCSRPNDSVEQFNEDEGYVRIWPDSADVE